MYELTVIDYFASAHSLRAYDGNCENLHGHNWKVEIMVQVKELNKIDLAIDFRELKKLLKKVLDLLDHKYLNDIEFFQKHNPSTENISKYIYLQLKKELERYTNVVLKKVISWEEHDSCAAYYE